MSLKTHKFARKPFYVDAVRVTAENMAEVAEWCRGEIQTDNEGHTFIKVPAHRPITDRQKKAYVRDWVLFSGTGFKVYEAKAFDRSFEKVKTLTKAQADEAGIRPPIEKKQPRVKAPVPTAPKKRPEPLNPVFSAEVVEKLTPAKTVPVVEVDTPQDEAEKLIQEVLRG